MNDPEAGFDLAIGWLIDARDMPIATTNDGHVERSDKRYELLHAASEIINLVLMDYVHEEGDVFRRIRAQDLH